MTDIKKALKPKVKDYGNFLALWRMLLYLRGYKLALFLMLMCMIGEALATMGTLSLIKPMTDLMFTGRLIDRPEEGKLSHFVLGRPNESANSETVGVVGVGGMEDQTVRSIRSFFTQYITPQTTTVAIDLTRVEGIGPEGWSAIALGQTMADQTTGTKLIVALPQNIEFPESVTTASQHSICLTTTSQTWQTCLTQIIRDAEVPPSPKQDIAIAANSFKAKAYDAIMPYIGYIERYSKGNLFMVMGMLLGVMLFFALLMAIFGYGLNYYASMLARIVAIKMQEELFARSMQQDVAYFARKRDADLMSIVMSDTVVVTDTVEIIFSGLVRTPITLVTLLIAMLIISPKLTLFCMTVLPVMGILIALLGRTVRRYGRTMRERAADQNVVVQEAYTGIRVIKAFNTEAREASRFHVLNNRLMRDFKRVVIATEAGERAIRLLGFITIGLMIFFGGWIVLGTRELSASDFTLFVALLSQVFRPLQAISKTNSRLQRGLACCDRIYAVLDEEPTIVDAPDATAMPKIAKEIQFKNLCFRYDNTDHDTLCDINITVPCGQKVAIVGETGSGKSTLVNLLPRFFDPTKGQILIDSRDIRTVTQASLRDQIALITQETVLFDDTVANNIAYGKPDATKEEIIEAAKQANAHKFITERLDNAYDTIIGTRGGRLSGGERQRLAIARAILKNAPILILDEATSALDTETESLIQEALDRVMIGRTVFVIAHRLSTIRNCDIIYVMDKGQIVESGSQQELLDIPNGRYARFYNIQFGGGNNNHETNN
ncbi:MAG: ABC transporter ATP-binding protein [Candidatus Sumerlaeales bacterium]|nr:ABC transporter ATP-binding protein [Candidatus Sumerlaeales bacterium]